MLVTFPDHNADAAPAKTAALDAVQQKMTHGPNVVTVSPPVFADDDRSALMSAVLSVDPEDLGARKAVDWMRHNCRRRPGPAIGVDVGGPTALLKDFDDRVGTTQPLVFVFVALIAFVMLLISIRSVFLALKGVLMTVLSVAAAYGSLVAVFQWGWLESLGLEPIASVDSTIPPLVLAMTFGLSMDYEIFLLTRIRERFLQTNNTRDAVAYGVSTSARTITSAALIMIAVFIGFAFAGMPLVAQLGVACAVAIAVDATVVRLVLVPALMAMFAQWNWWLPGWLDRVLPSVDFEKPLPKVDIGDLGHHPRRHLGARTVGLRTSHRGEVGGEAEDPRPRNRSSLPTRWPSAAACRQPRLRRTRQGRDGPKVRNPGPGRRDQRQGQRGAQRNQRRTQAERHHRRAPTDPANGAGRPARFVSRSTRSPCGGAGSPSHSTRCPPPPRPDRPPVRRLSPMETTNVQLPTGDRLQIPTGAETLRLKSYLVMCRNTTKDFASLPIWSTPWRLKLRRWCWPEWTGITLETAQGSNGSPPSWSAAWPIRTRPTSTTTRMSGPEAEDDWAQVRERCLSVAVAMLEEAR